jgi:hypothetical protein
MMGRPWRAATGLPEAFIAAAANVIAAMLIGGSFSDQLAVMHKPRKSSPAGSPSPAAQSSRRRG